MKWTSEDRKRAYKQEYIKRAGFYWAASQEYYDAIERLMQKNYKEIGLQWPPNYDRYVRLWGYPVEVHEGAGFPELQWRKPTESQE